MKNPTATQIELIKKYEINLEKVISVYSNDWRKDDYILFAEQELEAVKNGRQW